MTKRQLQNEEEGNSNNNENSENLKEIIEMANEMYILKQKIKKINKFLTNLN